MRSTIAFAIAAVVLGLLGAAFLGVARLEGHMADAGQRLSTLQYAPAQESLTAAEQDATNARFVPWLGSDARQEIRARQAAVQVPGNGSTTRCCRQEPNRSRRSTIRTWSCNSWSPTPPIE